MLSCDGVAHELDVSTVHALHKPWAIERVKPANIRYIPQGSGMFSVRATRVALAWSTTVVIHFERTTETPVRCNVVLILNPFAAERRHPFVPAEDVLINKALRGVVAYL